MLMPESYGKLKDFVGFRDNEIIAGPSGTSEPGATPAVTQTATPPLTPELRPVVVPEPVPEPATHLPEVVEPAMTHDSDSDTTIVAEDYWDADRRRRREQLLNQQSAMQTYRPVPPPNVPVDPSRSSTVQALRQGSNERSSLLRPQTQATAPNPPSKSQVPVSATRTGYGTVSSSSRPASSTHTPRSHGQVRSQFFEALERDQDLLIAAVRARARAWARARAAAKLKLAILKRKKPRRTWFSQLGFPFRVDFIFFGVASTDVRNRARAYDCAVATARAQIRQGGYESMITEAEVRAIEREVNAGPAYEYARIAPSDIDKERGCKGRLSMLAKGTLVVVILLVQAILLSAVVWSVVQYEADTAVVEWVARAAGKVVDAWEFLVYCFWWLVDFVVKLIISLLYLAFIIVCFALCCGGGA